MEPISIRLEALQLPLTMPLPKRADWGIGLVGFGDFAQRAHAPDYEAAGWPIVAVAVRNATAQEVARKRFGVERVYSDYRQLIDDPNVEIIDLVTQPNLREDVVRAAVSARKPIIVEKPFATTIHEGRRMVALAQQANVPLAIHQNYRWMKGNFFAHHITKGGWLGRPFFVGIELYGSQDRDRAQHPFYSECDNYLSLHWNTHLADLLRYWTGHDAKRVATHTVRSQNQNFKSDNLLMSLHDFGNGMTGHILHSELLHSSLGSNQCRIDGESGSLVFDFAGESILLESEKLDRGVHRLDTTDINWPEAICGSMGDLLLSIEQQREPEVSGENNLATISTVLAEIESIKADGKWIDVDHEV